MNASSTPYKSSDPSLFDDLVTTFETFTLDGLRYLREHSRLLIKGVYRKVEECESEPLGCIYNLASRNSALEIDSRDNLSLHLTGCRGPQLRDTCPKYLAARRVIKSWDADQLPVETVLQAADHVIERKTSALLSLARDTCIRATLHGARKKKETQMKLNFCS